MGRTRRSVWMAAMLMAVAPHAGAQSPPEPASLDVAGLLEAAALQPGSVQDAAFTLAPQTGRKLIALPVRLGEVTEATELDKPSFTLRGGGRFLGWQVPAVDPNAPQAGGFAAPPFGGQGMFFDPADPYGGFDEFGGAAMPMPMPVNPAVTGSGNTVPEGAPRIARKITLTPQGTVQWELDRTIAQQGQPNPQSMFALKARPDLVVAMQPQRPGATPRPAGGGFEGGGPTPRPPGGNTEQRRAEQAAFMEQVRAFNQLREQLKLVPEQFEQPAPPRVWAVYEVGLEVNDLSFAGQAPLPWRIGLADLTTLASMATAGGGRRPGQLDAQTNSNVLQLSQLAGDNHALTHRLIAAVLQRSNLAAAATRGDTIYRLLSQLLTAEDVESRRITLEALGAVNPPTPAATALLQEAAAAPSMPGELKVVALRGLMNGNFSNPQEAAATVRLIQATLNDPQGPDAGETLRQVVERVGHHPEATAALAGAVNFSQLSPQKLDEVIAYLVAAAPRSPLAAAWLDRGLLGAFNQQTAARTLERIAEADTGPSPARTLATFLASLVFTPPAEADGAAADDARLRLIGPLPITSAQHSLLNLLNSGDAKTRELAWRALLAFSTNPPMIDPNNPGFAPSPPPGQPNAAADAINRVLNAAMNQPQTPNTLAPFLARQQDPAATAALTRVLAEGGDAAAGQAATALLGSRRQIGAALMALDPAARATCGRRFYEQVAGEAMPVVHLLRHPEPGIAEWWGAQVAAGRVPQPSDWTQSVAEPTLIRLAGSSDADLAAGAVAALVFAAGGDRFTVDEQIGKFAALTDRSELGVSGAWASARQDIFTRRLGKAAGMYAVVLRVYAPGTGPQQPGMGMYDPMIDPYGAPPPAYVRGPGGVTVPQQPDYYIYEDEFGGAYPAGMPQPGAVAAPPKEVVLATVELVADGTSVSFRNATVAISVPADVFAIRLNNAGELKNFQAEALEQIDLGSIAQPIDLLPQADGSWKGAGMMRDGGTAEVELRPTTGE